MKALFLSILCICSLCSPYSVRAADIRIHDGDTFTIEGVKIRLWGIDAPELRQRCKKGVAVYECGTAAKMALEAFIGEEGDLICDVIDIDRYDRKVARCSVGGSDLGNMMVRAGQALAYRAYSDDFYSESESEAKKAQRGIWSTTFENPWDWRKRKKR